MFADDTKLYCPIQSHEDCLKLQSDLNRLTVWSKNWSLKFNESKCAVLRIKQSIKYVYSLNGLPLQDVLHQKDLGVIISKNLLPHDHMQSIVKKSNQRIGLIKRCFTDLTPDKVEILFNSLIRLILEYGSPSWNPWYLKDITNIEKVQRRCFKLCNTPDIVLEPLASRRPKTDLCEVYKYLNDMYKTNKNLYSVTSHSARKQSEAGEAVRPYTHQVQLLLAPSCQRLEQSSRCSSTSVMIRLFICLYLWAIVSWVYGL